MVFKQKKLRKKNIMTCKTSSHPSGQTPLKFPICFFNTFLMALGWSIHCVDINQIVSITIEDLGSHVQAHKFLKLTCCEYRVFRVILTQQTGSHTCRRNGWSSLDLRSAQKYLLAAALTNCKNTHGRWKLWKAALFIKLLIDQVFWSETSTWWMMQSIVFNMEGW